MVSIKSSEITLLDLCAGLDKVVWTTSSYPFNKSLLNVFTHLTAQSLLNVIAEVARTKLTFWFKIQSSTSHRLIAYQM